MNITTTALCVLAASERVRVLPSIVWSVKSGAAEPMAGESARRSAAEPATRAARSTVRWNRIETSFESNVRMWVETEDIPRIRGRGKSALPEPARPGRTAFETLQARLERLDPPPEVLEGPGPRLEALGQAVDRLRESL